jgi:hypothetical protein
MIQRSGFCVELPGEKKKRRISVHSLVRYFEKLVNECCEQTMLVVLLTRIRFIESIQQVSVEQKGRDTAFKRCVILPIPKMESLYWYSMSNNSSNAEPVA